MVRNRKSIWQRLTSVVLMLALLLSLAACGGTSADSGSTASIPGSTSSTADPQPTTPSTTEPTRPTLPGGTTAPTAPTDPTEPSPTDPPKPEEPKLVYTLTQEEVDAFYTMLSECRQLSLEGLDLDAIDASVLAVEEQYEYLNAQCTTAMILHYCHTDDAALEKQYLDCVDICTEANDAYLQMIREVYLSDTPAKDSLFEGWTQDDFDSLMAYDEQIVQLQQRNAEIGVEYRASDNDDRKIELYIEFVGNNNTIARFYGYDNYYTYAYERVYGRDYGQEEMELLRECAKTYLYEAYYSALLNFYDSFYDRLFYEDQLAVSDFLFEDYNTLSKDYVSLYVESLPQEMADALSGMLSDHSIFANDADSNPGAFTTMIGERSFCYFGPGYAGSTTIVHEGGHYFASLYADINAIPLDLAETHSQGNEWLFIQFVKEEMPQNQYKALVDYMLMEDISTILMCLMVDEFEKIVYSTDLTGYTAADLDAIMDSVSVQYFPDGDVSAMLADMNNYWRLVVVDQPVYYISYAVSAIAAMSLYTVAVDDYDSALASYLKLCQEPMEEDGFLGNISAAGLYTPFDEEFFKQLQLLIASRTR